MRENGKLDYLEFPADGGALAGTKEFYAKAFGWTFTDYGPAYAAFNQGLDGGFDANSERSGKGPLAVLFSTELEQCMQKVIDSGGTITTPIFSFPGGRRFHFTDPAGNELAVWAE